MWRTNGQTDIHSDSKMSCGRKWHYQNGTNIAHPVPQHVLVQLSCGHVTVLCCVSLVCDVMSHVTSLQVRGVRVLSIIRSRAALCTCSLFICRWLGRTSPACRLSSLWLTISLQSFAVSLFCSFTQHGCSWGVLHIDTPAMKLKKRNYHVEFNFICSQTDAIPLLWIRQNVFHGLNWVELSKV